MTARYHPEQGHAGPSIKKQENEVFWFYWPHIGQKELFSPLFDKRVPLT